MFPKSEIVEFVPFEKIWDILFKNLANESFFSITKYPFGPNPETIWQLLASQFDTGKYVVKIENWEDYEYGREKWDDNYFTNLLFNNIDDINFEWFYIITDDCFSKQEIYKVSHTDLRNFILNSKEIVGEYIFEGKDVIFIADRKFVISFISHTGYYLSVENFINMTS